MAVAFPPPQPLDPVEVDINEGFNHVVACARTGFAPGNLYYPRCVAIDPATNDIYIAEGGLFHNFARVSIFSESGDFLNNYTHERMKSLWGIAIHGDNVYVTDGIVHAVFHLLKIESHFRLVDGIGSRGSGIRQFDEPHQLSVSTNGDVYIADSNNDRIKILDSSLHPIKVITHQSMHRPQDVKLTTKEIYVLSSKDSSCVHVFTYTGHKVRSLITNGDGMQIYSPFFFCLDGTNRLIISDETVHKIKIFSNDGVLLHTLGVNVDIE